VPSPPHELSANHGSSVQRRRLPAQTGSTAPNKAVRVTDATGGDGSRPSRARWCFNGRQAAKTARVRSWSRSMSTNWNVVKQPLTNSMSTKNLNTETKIMEPRDPLSRIGCRTGNSRGPQRWSLKCGMQLITGPTPEPKAAERTRTGTSSEFKCQLWLKPARVRHRISQASLASYVSIMARSRSVDRWRTHAIAVRRAVDRHRTARSA